MSDVMVKVGSRLFSIPSWDVEPLIEGLLSIGREINEDEANKIGCAGCPKEDKQ